MKRLAIAVLVLGMGGTVVAQKAAKPAGGMKTEDCGAMMRSLVPLPTKMAELMTAVSEGIAQHAAMQSASKDPAAKAEGAALKTVADDHKAAADLMKKIAADMTAAGGTIKPAPHDMSKMDPKMMGDQMMKQAALEKEMAAMMMKHAEETEKQVAAMKAAK